MIRPHKGFFISFEGPEGGGKTAHAIHLTKYLREKDLDVVIIREPGGNAISEQIRDVIKDLRNIEMVPKTETLLFLGARAQIVESVIQPALKEEKIVIADRFRDSTIAYQGYAHGLGCCWADKLSDWVTGGLLPDLTLLLDLDVEVGLARKQGQGEWNRLDNFTRAFHRKVREAYRVMHSFDDTGRWELVDASAPEEEVFKNIVSKVEGRLLQAGFLEGGVRREFGH